MMKRIKVVPLILRPVAGVEQMKLDVSLQATLIPCVLMRDMSSETLFIFGTQVHDA